MPPRQPRQPRYGQRNATVLRMHNPATYAPAVPSTTPKRTVRANNGNGMYGHRTVHRPWVQPYGTGK
jgi:hypothetical protein